YWIGRYPITNAQWQAWVDVGGKHTVSLFAKDPDFNQPNQPVVGVDWYMCKRFCAWLDAQLNATVSLPTEQEWEAAPRGGDARSYPWGDKWEDDLAATEENRETLGAHNTVPVGCYPAGAAPCGASDMAGNVLEWTASFWQSYLHAKANYNGRVVRGGSF